MRVALVVGQFPSPEHPYIFDWVKGLLEKGVDLTVVTERLIEPPRSGFWSPEHEVWRHVRRLNLIDHPHILLFLRNAFSALRHPHRFLALLKVLRQAEGNKTRSVLRKTFEYLPLLAQEFDVIHFNAPQIAIRRFELKDLFGAASLVSFRGQDFTFYPDRYDRLLREADHLHFISQFLVEQARERGYDGSHHTLIHPMVDTDFYKPAPHAQTVDRAPHHYWTLFSAARLEWVKGWEFALQAVALLVERGWDVHYYIAGDGELKDLLVYTIDQLGIADHVHLLGWQSPEQVRDWMQRTDLYLLASVEEAFNNSVLQAQACGLPVVCSDEGGLPENIEDGVTGLLFRRRDAWDMAEKIEMLSRDPLLMSEMKKKAVERAQNFLTEKNTAYFVKMYQQVLDSSGR